MFDYEKLFEPFTGNGATLEKSIQWVKNSAGVTDLIMDQVTADAMEKISAGEKFKLPCSCGCGLDHVQVPLEHYMLTRAIDLKTKTDKAFSKVIQENEKQRVQSRMKQLSKYEKDYAKMLNGTFGQKIRKFIGMRYEHWENENGT